MRGKGDEDEDESYRPLPRSRGVLIHYSTSPRDLADDLPESDNGLYAHVFIEETPKSPGVGVPRLFNEIIGKRLVDGVVLNGRTRTQTPNLVAYPDDWHRIALYDTVDATRLVQAFAAMTPLESMAEVGAEGLEMACRVSIATKTLWSSAPEPAASAGITVAALLERIAKLHERMLALGFDGPDGLKSTAVWERSLVLPPLVHVAKKPFVVRKGGPAVGEYQTVQMGDWAATSALTLKLDSARNQLVYDPALEPSTLRELYLPTKGKAIGGVAGVFTGRLHADTASLVNAPDQLVMRFEPDSLALVFRTQVRDQLRVLKDGPKGSSFIIILPSSRQGPSVSLDSKRLTQSRLNNAVAELVAQGIAPGSVVLPNLDEDTPVVLETLEDTEILIKRTDPVAQWAGTVDWDQGGLDPSSERYLRAYEKSTSPPD
jgi:hypothetical protein